MAFPQPFPLAADEQTVQAPIYGPDLAVRLICPDCRDPHPNIIEQHACGDLVCGDCGYVLANRIVDPGREWRRFSYHENDPCRVGAPRSLLSEGAEQLHTIISRKDDGSGVSRELRRTVFSLQNPNLGLRAAFDQITTWCESFSLSTPISDIAQQLYKRSNEEKLLCGKPLDPVIAACIFIACRQANVPRTFREISSLTRVPKKILGRCYMVLARAFNLSAGANAQSSNDSNLSTRPEKLLARYCSHLHLPFSVESICLDIIVAARQHGLTDRRSPVSVVGGAIYFACLLLGEPRSIRDIGKAAGVSEGTIKLVYRDYYQDRDKLIKEKWIKNGKANLDNLIPVAEKKQCEGN